MEEELRSFCQHKRFLLSDHSKAFLKAEHLHLSLSSEECFYRQHLHLPHGLYLLLILTFLHTLKSFASSFSYSLQSSPLSDQFPTLMLPPLLKH